MKGFNFPLDPVLRIKKHDENTLLARYSQAVNRLTAARDAATLLKRQLTDEWRNHQAFIQQHPSPQMILQRQSGWAHIEEKIGVAENEISEAESEVTQLSQELATRRKDRQSIETYREKAHENHAAELDAATQRELDALSSLGHTNRQHA